MKAALWAMAGVLAVVVPPAAAKDLSTNFNGMTITSTGENLTINSFGKPVPARLQFTKLGLIDQFNANWGDRWRWGSVTKQLIAVLVLQEVERGQLRLDAPVAEFLPEFASPNAKIVTIRQLLRHQSGLPNPDDTPVLGRVPGYYSPRYSGNRSPLNGYCANAGIRPPGGPVSYNNCDYIVLGAVLERVTGKAWADLVSERIAQPLGLRSIRAFRSKPDPVDGFVDDALEPEVDLRAYDAAAGLIGGPGDLWKFDRALMQGKLLRPESMRELWDGRPELGFAALGQWVFTAPLNGCAKPVQIVERRGQIEGTQVRNFILPELDKIAIAFTNRAEFDFGEVWQGKGYSYDMLSELACR